MIWADYGGLSPIPMVRGVRRDARIQKYGEVGCSNGNLEITVYSMSVQSIFSVGFRSVVHRKYENSPRTCVNGIEHTIMANA